jgi:hypothetical protein
MHLFRPTRAAAAVLLAAALAGCSSKPATGEVRGRITFKGQPVAEGTVTFLNPSGQGDAEAKIEADGRYVIANPVAVGDYVVIVTPLTVIKDTDPGKTPPAPVEKPARDIPVKYRQPGTTPLKPTVNPGQNELDFDLTP